MIRPGSAVGLLEVRGLTAALAAADSMAKAAPVDVRGPVRIGDGLVTLAVVGEIGAIDEALATGREAAARLGQVVAWSRIGRPEPELAAVFGWPEQPREPHPGRTTIDDGTAPTPRHSPGATGRRRPASAAGQVEGDARDG